MKTAKHILQEEMDLLIEDIIEVYEKSGKKVTGNFAEELEARHKDNSVELFGVQYLAGRPKGQMPPVDAIEKWVIAKGIASAGVDASGLAWAIAKKIAKEGTADESHLAIYEEVLTPQRFDKILARVSEFHAQQFVNEVVVRMMSISQKYQK